MKYSEDSFIELATNMEDYDCVLSVPSYVDLYYFIRGSLILLREVIYINICKENLLL